MSGDSVSDHSQSDVAELATSAGEQIRSPRLAPCYPSRMPSTKRKRSPWKVRSGPEAPGKILRSGVATIAGNIMEEVASRNIESHRVRESDSECLYGTLRGVPFGPCSLEQGSVPNKGI